MNTKTTLLLAVALVVVGGGYLWTLREPASTQATDVTVSDRDDIATKKLFDTEPDTSVKMTCLRKGDDEPWVFERDPDASGGGQGTWRMTAPHDMPVTSYEVDSIDRKIRRLAYTVSYKPGDPGAVTPAQAGLDPPELVVTLTDKDGGNDTIEIGFEAGNGQTYVRIAGRDDICLAKPSLKALLKPRALEYRDRQAFKFSAGDVTRVEIDDESDADHPTHYAFVKQGAAWAMVSPAAAKATSKVATLVSEIARMRAIKWYDDRADKLGVYGLASPAITIRATVVTEPEPSDDDAKDGDPDVVADEEAAGDDAAGDDADTHDTDDDDDDADHAEPEPRETVYVLHVSDRSPIGQDTQVFFRVGDEPFVGAITKSTADKLKPVMTEWRDMSITTANVRSATKIDVAGPAGTTRLVRDGARWRFEADDAPAEADVVDELLTAIDDLRAVAFVDAASVEPAALGLDDPQVGIRLTIPGAPEVERITVGRYTDERLKRLVYVRRNEATSIAKVRAKSVAALLRGPTAYRDRTVFSFPANRIERVALDIENRFADGRMQLAFERADDMWRMVEPVAAPVRADRIKALVDGLASLRAEAVVGAAAELSAYGLQTPSATVTLTYKPPVEFRVEPAPAPDKDADPASDNDAESAPDQSGAAASAATSADTDAPDASQTGSGDVPDAEDAETGDNKIKMVPVQVQPPSQHYALAVAESGGKVYAKRSDLGTIFRLTDTFAKRLFDEYRMTAVLDFDDTDVVRFSIESGDTAYTFVRADDQWTLDAEPDLPLDQNKIKNLLLQLKDLRTDRYVVYGARDLPGFGLAPAARRVTVTMKDDSVVALLVSDKTCDADPSGGHYAVLQGRTNVFLLAPSTVRRFAVSLDDLERSD